VRHPVTTRLEFAIQLSDRDATPVHGPVPSDLFAPGILPRAIHSSSELGVWTLYRAFSSGAVGSKSRPCRAQGGAELQQQSRRARGVAGVFLDLLLTILIGALWCESVISTGVVWFVRDPTRGRRSDSGNLSHRKEPRRVRLASSPPVWPGGPCKRRLRWRCGKRRRPPGGQVVGFPDACASISSSQRHGSFCFWTNGGISVFREEFKRCVPGCQNRWRLSLRSMRLRNREGRGRPPDRQGLGCRLARAPEAGWPRESVTARDVAAWPLLC